MWDFQEERGGEKEEFNLGTRGQREEAEDARWKRGKKTETKHRLI